MKKIIFKNTTHKTTIIIKKNFIKKFLFNISNKDRKTYCIVDSKVKSVFKNISFKNIEFIYIHSSETLKNINNYSFLCEKLLSKGIDRSSILIAVGGGTLGDLCGFVASTVLRGVEFKLVPTTLLSQVDSSIGGKNGINTKYGKNQIGSFYHPTEILIDIDFLKSLPMRELKSGYAEIIKHALIKDKNFFYWLDKNFNELINLETKLIEDAIYKSIKIKMFYVNKDPFEKLKNKNSRSILNFGHTIGHSLETFYNYSRNLNHGEAVSIGMLAESMISNELKFLSKNELNIIISHFKKTKLKIKSIKFNQNKILSNIYKDKKNFGGKINMVLLKNIGNAIFYQNISTHKIKQILNKI